MEPNGPVSILSGPFVVGGVVRDSSLTFQEALALAVQNAEYGVPLGAILLFLVPLGKGGGQGGTIE